MTQETHHAIDESVLNALGQNQATIDRVLAQRLTAEVPEGYLAQLRSKGRIMYSYLKYGSTAGVLAIDLPLGESITFSGGYPIDQFPHALAVREEELKAKHPESSNAHPLFIFGINAIREGFGLQALESGDWYHGIDLLDQSSDGGIMNNKEVIKLLKELADANEQVATDIAIALQEKVDARRILNGSPTSA